MDKDHDCRYNEGVELWIDGCDGSDKLSFSDGDGSVKAVSTLKWGFGSSKGKEENSKDLYLSYRFGDWAADYYIQLS